MVVRRGEEWGNIDVPPTHIAEVHDDAEGSRLLQSGVREFLLCSGDMARTVGAQPPCSNSLFRRLPCDLVTVSLIDPRGRETEVPVFSHCILRSSTWRGTWLRGPITVISCAQFLRGMDIAPRGHPNDGKVEVLEFDASISVRERFRMLQRLRTGDHLPHPSIRVRHVATLDLNLRGCAVIDGISHGRCTLRHLRVIPDAITLWAAVPAPPSWVQE